MEIEFSCKGCIFSVMEDKKQKSCLLGRSDILNPSNNQRETEDVSHFLFNRFCNTYRPHSCLDDLYGGDLSKAVDTVVDEVIPRITYIINFNNNIPELNDIINDITVNQTVNNVGAVIVLNSKVEYNEEILELLNTKVYDLYSKKPYLVQMIADIEDDRKFDQAFNHAKNGWTLFLPAGQTIPKDFVYAIHNRINYEMKRFSFSHDEKTGRFIAQSSLYKLLFGNKGGPFVEKVKTMESDDNDSIVSWAKLFNE